MSTLSQNKRNSGNVPRALQRVIRFRLSDQDWKRLHHFRIDKRTSVQQICTDAIAQYMKQSVA